MHWVLKDKQEIPGAEAEGQSRGAHSRNVTYYQPSAPGSGGLFSAFPMEMTESTSKGSSCLSGAIPGLGVPTPCCRGCEALIKETAEAGPWAEGRETNSKEQRLREPGAVQGRARVRDRNKPCPLCFQGVPLPSSGC